MGLHSPRSIRALEAIQSELEVEDQSSLWMEGDRRFHETLYAPCRRPRTLQMIKTLRNIVERFCIAYLHHDVRRAEWGKEHRALIAGITGQDVAMAQQQLTAHLRTTEQVVLAAIEDCIAGGREPDFNCSHSR
ncbi:MAG TPA: FCD domain-containing protein [Tepidisphaeraceae bacterium]|nr:FCD domain-containing protein [Tepidisphaeraceae bacterium]